MDLNSAWVEEGLIEEEVYDEEEYDDEDVEEDEVDEDEGGTKPVKPKLSPASLFCLFFLWFNLR